MVNEENRHGTRCAGEIVGSKSGGKCSTGIAFDAKFGVLKILDGPVSDIMGKFHS